ncbi:MAG: glutamate--cysteine ligase [Gammaproteobacteria bacterium]|nr:glutamate--cysteine ligase [Gammaproteobacteria bacterium]
MNPELTLVLELALENHGSIRVKHGIEKEALRITRDGYLSRKPHPSELGAALTHPSITTDFSESQLEFVTRAHSSIEECLNELDDIHRFVYAVIEGERLWPASMPCMLRGEASIPLAQFGTSNAGQVKTIYRRGLANRYGRYMQSISGLHYNFSISDELWKSFAQVQGVADSVELRNRGYLSLIRNFQRIAWLPIYLFGASPAVCGSFVATNPDHELEELDGESFYLPYATSLRQGSLGYQSSAQKSHYISYNSLRQYSKDMMRALTEPYKAYEEIGIKSEDGEHQQLSTSLLQIEAECYGPIRPKPKSHSGLRPLQFLNSDGIEYLEVRCLDLNPFLRTGIDGETAHFLDALLLFAWLKSGYKDSPASWSEVQENQSTTVAGGRDPGTMLMCDGSSRSLREWAMDILKEVEPVCNAMDSSLGSTKYRSALETQRQKVTDPSKTPSAQILARMTKERKSYYRLIDSLADEHQQEYLGNPLNDARSSEFDRMAKESIARQRKLEDSESQTFEEYLSSYMQLHINL